MDATFVWKLAKLGRLGSSHLRYDDDFVDRLNYQVTGILLFLFIGTIGIKQYIGNPIQCLVPQEFPRSWEEYAENYCWVSNTYYVPIKDLIDTVTNRRELMIGYYQWTWIFLLVQALLFYLPCILWRGLYNQSRFNIRSIIQMSDSATDTIIPLCDKGASSSSNSSVRFIATYLDGCIRRRLMGLCRTDNDKINSSWCCNHRSGNCLIYIYLFTKVLYIINAICQVYLMEVFIGTKYTFYGVRVLYDVLKGHHWTESGHLRRVTFCNFSMNKLGRNYMYTTQCVLPINMILEKIFTILWFWIVFLAIINICSFFVWCSRLTLSRNRVRFIRTQLHIMGSLMPSDRPKSKEFVEHYLGADIVFIIRLISMNTCEFAASQLANELWIIYRHNEHAELEDMKFGQASLSPSQKFELIGPYFGNISRRVPFTTTTDNVDIALKSTNVQQ